MVYWYVRELVLVRPALLSAVCLLICDGIERSLGFYCCSMRGLIKVRGKQAALLILAGILSVQDFKALRSAGGIRRPLSLA